MIKYYNKQQFFSDFRQALKEWDMEMVFVRVPSNWNLNN